MMASHAPAAPRQASLDAMLATIPSLPRPILSRLVARMIDHLDAMDPDPDLEPEEDRCSAWDEGCGAFYINGRQCWGSELADEGRLTPVYGIDQTAGPTTTIR